MRWWMLGVGGLAAMAAAAETPTKDAPKETVTVAAKRATVQVLPDRTVYSLDKSVQATTGSMSDVLRNLPSVEVDNQGKVSLRGDANVTILIDGKQSPLLAGNRADALQQLPANLIDRVEVITNPSAEYRAEGSAGIINIVLRKDKELAASGLVRAIVGDQGRLNLSASGNLNLGRLHLHGAYGERRDRQKSVADTERGNGVSQVSSQTEQSQSIYSGRWLALSSDIDASPADVIDIGSSYNRFAGHINSAEHNISVPDASDSLRNGQLFWRREGVGANLGYRHKFAAEDEEFNFDLSRYTSWGRNDSDYTTLVTATDVADYWQSRNTVLRESHTELKTGYALPLPGPGKFKIGYALQNDTILSDNTGLWRDPTMSDWAVDTTFLNDFRLDRTVHAGYVSYEQKFGRFGVMGGLRLEQDFLNTDLVTTGEVHDTSSLGLYPSLHLSYAFTDTQQAKLSYSRRMNRPGASVLDPARYSSDAFNVWAGNPLLKPEQVDSYEASYHYIGEKTDLVLTGYYRATYHGITSVYRYLTGSVLLTTLDNLARRNDAGGEANLNVTLFEGLTLRTTATLAYNSFNPGPSGLGVRTSGLTWNIRGGFDWQATEDDTLQFNAAYSGKQHLPQGWRDPTLSGDLGFKHRFGDGLSGVVSVNNLFDSWDHNGGLDSPGLYQNSHYRTPGRVFYFGLVYSFGGVRDTGPAGGESGGAPMGGPGGPGGP